MSSAKKLISTILAIFDFFFHLRNMIQLVLLIFALNFYRKSQKNKKIMINIFYSIFCIFLKTHRFWLSLLCRNEFCMQKYPNKHISIGFAENSHLWLSFCKGYCMVIFHVIGQKIHFHSFSYIWLFSI